MRSISDKEGLTLKAATRRALTMAGGGDSFQHVTRVSAAQLSKYSGQAEEKSFMPIDVAVEADIEANSPIILSAMAEILGYQLVPAGTVINVAVKPVTIKDALTIANEAADVVKAITEALTDDDRIDGAEERAITREIDETMRALQDVLGRLRIRA
ncbi:phage regulatory CII family protein [Rhizobium leucaenae]|uniref:phage regulatory CII family protein n=1 Tax=Rhizobium leucaenae TaxID=29450 RepID=UPI0007EE94CD|nr:phage regulatory CII family protein [Rhizobium leucaenae]